MNNASRSSVISTVCADQGLSAGTMTSEWSLKAYPRQYQSCRKQQMVLSLSLKRQSSTTVNSVIRWPTRSAQRHADPTERFYETRTLS